jgi:hypothetical protein
MSLKYLNLIEGVQGGAGHQSLWLAMCKRNKAFVCRRKEGVLTSRGRAASLRAVGLPEKSQTRALVEPQQATLNARCHAAANLRSTWTLPSHVGHGKQEVCILFF